MMNDTLKLTDAQVLAHARDLLQEHLPLAVDGNCCTTDDLLNALLGIVVNRSTLEAVCTDWVAAPDPETVRRHLNEQLCVEDLPKLEQRLNAALRAEIPPRVWRQARDVAIDFHDRPYYGKQPQSEGLWVRGKARDGTTRFYRIATAYVMLNGLRVTLALRFVLPEIEVVSLLDDLLKSLKKQGFQIACLFLDKGFASIAVMEYLTRRAQPALIACPIRGKAGGTRALCQGRRSYRTTHTFVSGDQTFTASRAVCRSFTTAKRTKRLKHRAVWLLYILIELDLSPRQARRWYRKRFGIEIVYTQMTKPGLFACLAGRDDIADLDLVIRDDDAIDQQFQQLPFLLKCGRRESCLHPLTKIGHRVGQRAQVRMLINLMVKLVFVCGQGVDFVLKFGPAAFVFRHSNDGAEIRFSPTL